MTAYYDPFSFACFENPFPIYRELRDEAPIYYNENRDFWAISRYEDIQAAARDPDSFSSAWGNDIDGTGAMYGAGNFIAMDPPRHTELRKIVRDKFKPKAIAAMEDEVRERTQELLAPIIEEGRADLAKDLSWALPIGIASSMLGFPREDEPLLLDLFVRALDRTIGDPRLPESALRATSEIKDYFDEMVKERRARADPGDDLMGLVVAAESRGDLLHEEVEGMSHLLFTAAIETTASLTSTALALLAQHPDQRQRLIEERSLVPTAIEEVLRFDSPVQNVTRRASRDVTFQGVTIPEKAWVVLVLGSANRDERRFEDPDTFNIERDQKRLQAFGEGIHFCLGAPVARLEARVALEEVLSAIPDYEIVGAPVRMTKQILRGFSSLPVAFTPAASVGSNSRVPPSLVKVDPLNER